MSQVPSLPRRVRWFRKTTGRDGLRHYILQRPVGDKTARVCLEIPVIDARWMIARRLRIARDLLRQGIAAQSGPAEA